MLYYTDTKGATMLKANSITQDEDFVATHYKCNKAVKLAGDSIWDCTLTEVCVTDIYINEGVEGGDYDGFRSVNVYYTVDGDDAYKGSWRLYTDTGFVAGVRRLLSDDSIYYTEQGMQDDGVASME